MQRRPRCSFPQNAAVLTRQHSLRTRETNRDRGRLPIRLPYSVARESSRPSGASVEHHETSARRSPPEAGSRLATRQRPPERGRAGQGRVSMQSASEPGVGFGPVGWPGSRPAVTAALRHVRVCRFDRQRRNGWPGQQPGGVSPTPRIAMSPAGGGGGGTVLLDRPGRAAIGVVSPPSPSGHSDRAGRTLGVSRTAGQLGPYSLLGAGRARDPRPPIGRGHRGWRFAVARGGGALRIFAEEEGDDSGADATAIGGAAADCRGAPFAAPLPPPRENSIKTSSARVMRHAGPHSRSEVPTREPEPPGAAPEHWHRVRSCAVRGLSRGGCSTVWRPAGE